MELMKDITAAPAELLYRKTRVEIELHSFHENHTGVEK